MSYLIFSVLSVCVLAPIVGVDTAVVVTIGAGLLLIAIDAKRCEIRRR